MSAHPYDLVVGEIGSELSIPPSTLSHHLEKLKNEALVKVRRESTFLRYTANTQALQDILRLETLFLSVVLYIVIPVIIAGFRGSFAFAQTDNPPWTAR